MSVINNNSLGRFFPISWTITLFWGLVVISLIDEPRVRLRVGHQHSHIWPNRVLFVHYYSVFWGPRGISTIDEPLGAFTCGHQHSHIRPILVRFVHYYSVFWGPKAISMVVKPQAALTCRSARIAVWDDSSPFLGLLLTVLGSQSDFHD